MQCGIGRGGELLIKHGAVRPLVLADAMAPKAPVIVITKIMLLKR